jgi:ribosomal protein L7/L12
MIAVTIGASIVVILTVCQRIWALERRVITLNSKLDALLKHSRIKYDPMEGLSEQVIEALKQGDKIEAVSLYKTATGASLKEAKQHIEDVQIKGEF